MKQANAGEWTKGYIALLIVFGIVAIFGTAKFEEYLFNPVTRDSIIDLLVPLFIIALFLERAQEVFITAWRGLCRTPLEQDLDAARAKLPKDPSKPVPPNVQEEIDKAAKALANYKAGTKRRAFLFGLGAGLLISIVGVRVLRPMTNWDADPVGLQKTIFDFVDIVLTGALIGGGSDGIHKIMSVITDYLDVLRDKNNATRPLHGATQ